VHAPETQAWLEQAVAFCQDPAAEQVCGCWPLHAVWDGAHTPWQAPATQVWFEQTAPEVCQVPVASHVCGCCPLHRVLPGPHEPEHAPPTQAWLVQATAAPHVPSDWHVSTPLPEHWV
jgi:hypothetical protein